MTDTPEKLPFCLVTAQDADTGSSSGSIEGINQWIPGMITSGNPREKTSIAQFLLKLKPIPAESWLAEPSLLQPVELKPGKFLVK